VSHGVAARHPRVSGGDARHSGRQEAATEHPVELSVDEARERILGVLAEEVGRMLAEGVVAAPMDIDLAMITGAGFQFWNGGLCPLLDREGASDRVLGRHLLPAGVASVPA